MPKSTVVIDYGMSNLASLTRGMARCGVHAQISADPATISQADQLILPGVGAFAEGMSNLRQRGLFDPIREAVLQDGKPILGICLGMQLMASSGSEGRETAGLDLIQGQIVKLEPGQSRDRVPHVGWNNLEILGDNLLLHGISPQSDYYFVHSYHFIPQDQEVVVAQTPHCGHFVSVIHQKNIWGVQFHPEKSAQAGLTLLANFVNF